MNYLYRKIETFSLDFIVFLFIQLSYFIFIFIGVDALNVLISLFSKVIIIVYHLLSQFTFEPLLIFINQTFQILFIIFQSHFLFSLLKIL